MTSPAYLPNPSVMIEPGAVYVRSDDEGRAFMREVLTRARYAPEIERARTRVSMRWQVYRHHFSGTRSFWRARVREAIASVRELEAERDAKIAALTPGDER